MPFCLGDRFLVSLMGTLPVDCVILAFPINFLLTCCCVCDCSDPHLQFVEEIALPPPEVQIDIAEQERNERELAEAVNAPLPADDDDELID